MNFDSLSIVHRKTLCEGSAEHITVLHKILLSNKYLFIFRHNKKTVNLSSLYLVMPRFIGNLHLGRIWAYKSDNTEKANFLPSLNCNCICLCFRTLTPRKNTRVLNVLYVAADGFCELLKAGESLPEHGLLQKHAECKTKNGRDTQIGGLQSIRNSGKLFTNKQFSTDCTNSSRLLLMSYLYLSATQAQGVKEWK